MASIRIVARGRQQFQDPLYLLRERLSDDASPRQFEHALYIAGDGARRARLKAALIEAVRENAGDRSAAFIPPAVLTLDELAGLIAQRLAIRGRPLPKALQPMLTAAAFADLDTEDAAFFHPGVAPAPAILRELWQMLASYRQRPLAEAPTDELFERLAALDRSYRDIRDEFVDSADLKRAAIVALKERSLAQLLDRPSIELIVDGLQGRSPLDLDLLRALISSGQPTTLGYRSPAAAGLLGLVGLEEESEKQGGFPDSAAADLGRQLEWRSRNLPGRLRRVTLKSSEQELRWIARELKQRNAQQPLAIEQIAIALIDTSSLRSARGIFEEYEIELQDHFGDALSRHSVTTAVLGPLRLLADGSPQMRWIELLLNRHFQHEPSRARRRQLAHLLRMVGPDQQLHDYQGQFEHASTRHYPKTVLLYGWRDFQHYRERLQLERTPTAVANWVTRHRTLLAGLNFRYDEEEPGLLALFQLLGQFAGLSEREVTLEQYLALLEDAIGQARIPRRGKGVHLIALEQLDSIDCSIVYVPGLHEDLLPRAPAASFLHDAAREALGLPNREAQLARQWDSFLRLLSYPEVTLLRPSDDEGVPLLPSPFLIALEQVAPELERPAAANGVFSHREQQSWLWQNDFAAPDDLPQRDAIADGMMEVQTSYLTNKGLYGGLLSGKKPQQFLNQRFHPGFSFSPTQLERYAKCPFQYFMSDVLRLETPGEITPDLQTFERGQLVHRILSRFFEEWPRRVSLERLDEAREVLLQIAEPELDRLDPHLWGSTDRRLIETVLEGFLQLEAATSSHNARPRHLEIGLRWQVDPMLSLRGQVDRIDVDPDGGFVIYDYKTGSSLPVGSFSQLEKKLADGTALQLLLYLHGFQQRNPEMIAAGFGYIHLKNQHKLEKRLLYAVDSRAGQTWSDEAVIKKHGDQTTLDGLADGAVERARSIAASIRDGRYPVKPQSDSHCTWCRYHRICRVEEHDLDEETELTSLPEPPPARREFLRPKARRKSKPRRIEQPVDESEASSSSEIKLSPAQEAACDITRHVVLTAPAGSGKTAVLVERYLRLLGAGVKPESILALTFTRKASREMKQRLLARAQHDPRASGLALKLQSLRISTLHGFCAELLRRYAREAQLPPNFQILEETENGIQLVERVGQMIDRAAVDVNDPLHTNLAPLAGLFSRRSIIATACATLRDRAVIRPHLTRCAALDGESYAELWFTARDRELERLLEPLLSGAVRGILEQLGRLFLRAPQLRGPEIDCGLIGDSGVDWNQRVEALNALLKFALTRGRLKKRFPGRKSAEKTEMATHLAALESKLVLISERLEPLELVATDREPLATTPAFARLVLGLESELYRWKSADGLLDFTDIEEYTVALLQQEHVLHDLHRGTAHLLLDEYQDTSDLQWVLVERLISEWFAGAGAPTPGPLKPTLFLVGDKNQSIYGFRNANAELLAITRDYLLQRSDRVNCPEADANYRSAPAIMAAVNSFAEQRFSSAASQPHRQERGSVTLHVYPRAERPLEAQFVAQTIQKQLDSVSADEIAVLVRTRSQMAPILSALQARRIPCQVYKDPGYFWKSEVLDLVHLLRVLVDPFDDLALVRLLRSPLFGYSDLDLTYLCAPQDKRAAQIGFDFQQPVAESTAPQLTDRSLFERFYAAYRLSVDNHRRRIRQSQLPPPLIPRAAETWRTLGRWLTDCHNETPERFLKSCFLERGGETLYGLRGREQAIANIDKFFSLLTRLSETIGPSYARLAHHLDQIYAQEVSEEEADPLDRRRGVQLMTVHAAKGLEFPVVILPGIHRGIRSMHSALAAGVLGGEQLLALKAPDVENGAHRTLKRLEGEAELAEEARLLYVAMTRARDRLVICGAYKPGSRSNSWMQMLLDSYNLLETAIPLDETEEHPIPGGRALFGPLEKPTAQERYLRMRFAPYEPPPLLALEPLTSAEPSTAPVTQLVREAEPAPFRPLRLWEGPTPSSVGVVIHRLLQLVAELGQDDEEQLRHLLPAILDEAGIFDATSREGLQNRALTAIKRLLADPQCRPLLLSDEQGYTELEFQLNDDQSTVGIIDRLIRHTDGSLTIVDYKTTALSELSPVTLEQRLVALTLHYAPQLTLYARAARALFGTQTVRTRLLFTDLPRVVAVEG